MRGYKTGKTNRICKFREFAMKCMILYNTDKQVKFLRFSKLIKISRRKYRMLFRTRSNNLTCKSAVKHQAGERYSKYGKINA